MCLSLIVPTVTDQHTPGETFQSPPFIRRKGSTAGIVGADPLTAQILQRTGTDSTIIANAINNPGVTVDGNGLVSANRSSDMIKRVGGDVGTPQGLNKEKKWVAVMLSRDVDQMG